MLANMEGAMGAKATKPAHACSRAARQACTAASAVATTSFLSSARRCSTASLQPETQGGVAQCFRRQRISATW